MFFYLILIFINQELDQPKKKECYLNIIFILILLYFSTFYDLKMTKTNDITLKKVIYNYFNFLIYLIFYIVLRHRDL